MIKLSTKESDEARIKLENELKARREQRVNLAPQHHYILEQKYFQEVIDDFNAQKRRRLFVPEDNPQEVNQLYF